MATKSYDTFELTFFGYENVQLIFQGVYWARNWEILKGAILAYFSEN